VPSLRHSSDREPGYTRRRRGRGFSYHDERGRAITDERVLRRLRGMAIPPAWKDVWICRSSRGHLQATGIDAAGRKQYLYHPAWREERDREKYERILDFAERLPAFRRTVDRHLARGVVDRDTALAAAVRIIDRTGVRVGSEEYAESAGTYGVATIRSRHLTIDGDTLVLDFKGKGGVEQHVELRDRKLARIVAEMDGLPGYEVLKYVDESGEVVDVRSEDVNAYIKEHLGEGYSSKDFRTWAATVAAAVALDELEPAASDTARRRAVAGVCRAVSEILGNTPAVCRASYIDPRVIDRYLEGTTLSGLAERRTATASLSQQERAVLSLLRDELT
jgi:DNA topoisomerase I